MPAKTPTILVADDDDSIRFVLEAALTQAGYQAHMARDGAELVALAESGVGDAVITDVAMPGLSGFDAMNRLQQSRPNLPIIVISARQPLATAVQANQLGAFEFLAKPFDLHELMSLVQRCLITRSAANDGYVKPIEKDGLLIGDSPAMQELYRTIARVVDVDLTVMISGASGTGKERVARALHELSKRAHKSFVAQNMAAIPKELIESELFGHERGAFTGAQTRKPGKFEQAEGGTLFLDEIGDMPLDAQTRLLRVLQEGEYIPVGGTMARKADVRIICATHRDLRALVEVGKFREDLYYRLQVIPIRLPSLRQRASDIPALVAHFLTQAPTRGLAAKRFTPAALRALMELDWPGNVRELEHLVYRLCALVSDTEITDAHVHAEATTSPVLDTQAQAIGVVSTAQPANLQSVVRAHAQSYINIHEREEDLTDLYEHMLEAVEKPLLDVVMSHSRNNQLRAARILGINRNTLRKLLKKYGLI
jgi:two-component system nitrogen regulation response regulator GlnG